MSDWYCRINGDASGPFSREELRFLINRGKLGPDAEVQMGTAGCWTRAGNVSQLFPTGLGPEGLVSAGVLDPRNTEPSVAEPDAESSEPLASETPPSLLQPPVGAIDNQQDADTTRQRIIIGSSILAGLLLLLLLFLVLLHRDPVNGGLRGILAQINAGEIPDDGVGDGIGDGGGKRTDDDTEGLDESEEDIVDEGELTEETSKQVASTGVDHPPQEDLPLDAMLTIERLGAAGVPPQGGDGDGGGLGDFQDRVEREGGQTGEVQITLIWENVNDLDLHVVCPSGERIFFSHLRSQCNGFLDVDMNAGGQKSNTPVENVFWPEGGAPQGQYTVIVKHYANHGAPDPTEFEVAIKNGGKALKFSGRVQVGQEKRVHTFSKE